VKSGLKTGTDLSLEINHVDSHISLDKNRFSRFKSEIVSFRIWTLYNEYLFYLHAAITLEELRTLLVEETSVVLGDAGIVHTHLVLLNRQVINNMYSVHCTVHCTLYTVHCTIINCTMYIHFQTQNQGPKINLYRHQKLNVIFTGI
jgi:hypothetical protein